MAEQILDVFEVGTGGMREGRRPMPQIVQPDGWQAGALDEFAEAGGGVVRVDRQPIGAGEHIPRVGPRLPVLQRLGALVELVAAVCPQHLHRAWVQGDDAVAGGGFGVAFHDVVAGGGPVAFDAQYTGVEVDVDPA